MRFPVGNLLKQGRPFFAWIALALSALFAADAPGICPAFAATGLCDDSPPEEDGEIRDAHLQSARPDGARIRIPTARPRPVRMPSAHVPLSSPTPFADSDPFERGLSPRLRC